ncbi:hypothetical protein [Luteimonas mephitis]|uniref:hypothetical protein n=1 Tax=Luteimonas mephitis TaxID=83615 RepID=UPI00047E9A5B|nr:hypothetical protein [Luteimonas mephitis]
MKHATKMSGLIAIVAAAAMPLAFAQTAPTTDDGAAQDAAPSAAPTAEPKQVTWADLDVDKDGSLSKAEVATVPALAQVFDAADADADGKLTADEYKAHAAAGDAGAGADDGGE